MNVIRKQRPVSELDITPMIDCVFQLIMFFMVIIALIVVVGIAIKFPDSQEAEKKKDKSKEKNLFAYVGKDVFDADHNIKKHGVIKICGKDYFIEAFDDSASQANEYKTRFDAMELEMKRLIEEEDFKKDQILVTGEVLTYHWKIVKLIDLAKKNNVKGFSLTPPR